MLPRVEIIALLVFLGLEQSCCQYPNNNYLNWNKYLSDRNGRNYKQQKTVRPPSVPHLQQSSQQHTRTGPDWNFDRGLSRASGHYHANEMVNGIPYGKSGYRG